MQTNIKYELIEHIDGRKVKFIKLRLGDEYSDVSTIFQGGLSFILKQVGDLSYDSGFGGQELFGYIWYEDGTWSERGEYDGSEWWEHKDRPPFDIEL